MVDCKNALVEANGDETAAIEILRKKGMATAGKKAGRVTAEGVVGSYIHMGGKVGVLVEINCESDFVARGEEFQQLVKDVAMHIAATDPRFTTRDEVPADLLDKEREIMREQLKNDPKNASKPEECAARSALRKGPVKNGCRARRGKDRFDQGKHHYPAFHPIQNGRRHRKETRRFRCGSSIDGGLTQWSVVSGQCSDRCLFNTTDS